MTGADFVVVLNYKGASDTIACVESLITGSPSVQVLVVDNGSDDGVVDQIVRRWPIVHTLQTGANLGFSGGMNAGVQWALDRSARTVTVLNNDTIVPPGAINQLLESAITGRVISPEVRYAGRPDDVWFGGGVIDPETSLPRHLQADELTAGAFADSASSSAILAGCCLVATAEVWRTVGLFDDRFFLMFEDSEWSVRASRLGIPLVVDHDVTISHKVSASFKGPFIYLGLYYYTRNGLLFGGIVSPWNITARLRFLRRHVLIVPAARVRGGQLLVGVRLAAIVGLAVAARVFRVFGRAPAYLERLSSTWAESDANLEVIVPPRK